MPRPRPAGPEQLRAQYLQLLADHGGGDGEFPVRRRRQRHRQPAGYGSDPGDASLCDDPRRGQGPGPSRRDHHARRHRHVFEHRAVRLRPQRRDHHRPVRLPGQRRARVLGDHGPRAQRHRQRGPDRRGERLLSLRSVQVHGRGRPQLSSAPLKVISRSTTASPTSTTSTTVRTTTSAIGPRAPATTRFWLSATPAW